MTLNSRKTRQQQPTPGVAHRSGQSLSIETLMANSMHDLKNTVSVLLGQIDALYDDHKSTERVSKTKLSRLQLEGEYVKASLMHLLALYRMDRQQYCVNIEEQAIAEMFASLQAHYSEMLANQGITLEINCHNSLYWFIDKNLIESLLHNLIINACRHAQENIVLTATIKDNYLEIGVMDDGPGYPSEMLSEYQSGRMPINHADGNTGLGIYFATQIASLHRHKNRNGYINIANRKTDTGGCFTLCLP